MRALLLNSRWAVTAKGLSCSGPSCPRPAPACSGAAAAAPVRPSPGLSGSTAGGGASAGLAGAAYSHGVGTRNLRVGAVQEASHPATTRRDSGASTALRVLG